MANQIFVVVALTGIPEIHQELKKLASDGFYTIKEGVWFVLFDATSQELAEKLGIRDARNGTGVVTPITNYSGRGPTDMWEWLKVHWPKEIPR
ncbi:MAG: hypothetical protein ACREC1_07105 [Methylovirgula sp.]